MRGSSAHFTRTFAAAHRVWNDPGKCRNIHGHNYHVEVDVDTDGLTDQGFTVPFDAIKDVIDTLDHSLIVHEHDPLILELQALALNLSMVPQMPSTENLAQLIAERIAAELKATNKNAGSFGVSVKLSETDHITAYGTAQGR